MRIYSDGLAYHDGGRVFGVCFEEAALFSISKFLLHINHAEAVITPH